MNSSCSTVARRLAEYHDGELTIDQRVAIQEHLRACPRCEAKAEALKTVSSALRVAVAERAFSEDWRRLDGMAAGVISRFRAEREESFSHTLQRMFEDLHLVWAALGATAATFACLALTVGIFYFSRAQNPDSLAAMMSAVSNAGTDAHPIELNDSEVVLPRQEATRLASVPELTTDDELMLDTTITREGRVSSLQIMDPSEPAETDWNTVGSTLDAVAQARFLPARVGGEPVAVKMFWFFTHTTVRPKTSGHLHVADPTHVV
jgi:hypothetical protein